jgi:tRNA (cmo5U34)-methyltransferase
MTYETQIRPDENADTGYAADRWAFDDEVTRVFDDMLERSIPGYKSMRAGIIGVAAQMFNKMWGDREIIVDIGTSRGQTIASLLPVVEVGTRFIGLEVSTPMVEAATERFKDDEDVTIRQHDLTTDSLPVLSHVTSILSLMFTPIEDRPRIVGEIADAIPDGGTFILVEKLMGETPITDQIFTDAYYDFKREHGYSEDDILRKRASLSGVLVPQTARENQAMLLSAGFSKVECFWRQWNFAGWIAVK